MIFSVTLKASRNSSKLYNRKLLSSICHHEAEQTDIFMYLERDLKPICWNSFDGQCTAHLGDVNIFPATKIALKY